MTAAKRGMPGRLQTVASPRAKKAYAAPRLVEYGTVAKITAASTASTNADASTMMMMPCL